MDIEIKRIDGKFSVCKVVELSALAPDARYCFTAVTDAERSVICQTKDVPQNTTEREDGWRAFRIEGVLDFSLIGVLAEIATLLAKEQIALLAVSTYNTDYVFVKQENEGRALATLADNGYKIL